MKKQALLIIIIGIIAACSDDDDGLQQDRKLNAPLVGQWENISDSLTQRRNYLFTEDFKVSFFIKNRETGYTTRVNYRDVEYTITKDELYYSDGSPLLTYFVYHKDTIYINGKDSTRIYKRIP